MTAADLIAQLQQIVPSLSLQPVEAADGELNPTILVAAAQIENVCGALRDTPGLEFVAFSDVTAADHFPGRRPRFDVVYHLVSPHRRARVRLKVQLDAGERIPSVTSVWPGAGWPEREVFDLFGIEFDNHPDLRRLMMPDDWEGHPLRKDYPVQVKKDAQTFMPLQVTEEEFRANMERDRRVRPAPGGPSQSTGESA
ncbi:MAG TPA: NADH-quinone oxidoreductase subunit C [Vicinamibacterales bacterium]|nr:NADH-quinone oxidoreductase subunit C [Vicinamibacterales bacterium]